MKKHTIEHIIKKQGGNAQIMFRDGETVFWPSEFINGLKKGTMVREHKHKNGQTVAFSWDESVRFVGTQPRHLDESMAFLQKFSTMDMIRFNNALVRAMNYKMDVAIMPDLYDFAHNLVLFGLSRANSRNR